jgi:transposase
VAQKAKRRPAAKQQPARIVSRQTDVAEHFGVSVDTVGDWRKLGMPGRRGRWDLQAIKAWRDDRKASSNKAPVEIAEQLGRARLKREVNAAEREASRARREAIELQRVEGSLVDAAAVDEFLSDLAASLRTAGRLLRQKFGEQAAGLVETAIRDWDKRLARHLSDVRDEVDE